MDKEYAKELIGDLGSTSAINGEAGVANLKIVYRGEGLFYHSAGRAFICPMSVAGDWVESKNIKKWHAGAKITKDELATIKLDILHFFESTQKMQINFIE
jgi:hypothetical protein